MRQTLQTRLLPYSSSIFAASNMTMVIDRPVKLLANREEVDVRVPFLQSALGERTNSNTQSKHDQRDQWKVLRWANMTA